MSSWQLLLLLLQSFAHRLPVCNTRALGGLVSPVSVEGELLWRDDWDEWAAESASSLLLMGEGALQLLLLLLHSPRTKGEPGPGHGLGRNRLKRSMACGMPPSELIVRASVDGVDCAYALAPGGEWVHWPQTVSGG